VQIPKIIEMQALKKEIDQLRKDNDGPLKEIGNLVRKRTALYEERNGLNKKRDNLKVVSHENKQEVELIKQQIDSVKKVENELKRKLDAIYAEWDQKWYKYEAYMKEVEYIRACKKKQHDIKRNEEKAKKRAEKEAKKEGGGDDEINIQKSDETHETVTCKTLVNFFRSMLNPNPEKNSTGSDVNPNKNNMSDKLNEDLKKGLIEIVDHDKINNQTIVGIPSKRPEKKEKGPKTSKREQKSMNTELLALGVDVLAQIKELGMTAPYKKSQVESFVLALEAKLTELKAKKVSVVETPTSNSNTTTTNSNSTNIKTNVNATATVTGGK